MACYAADVKVKDFDGNVLMDELEAIRGQYGPLFRDSPQLRADIPRRIVAGDYVIDEEDISGMVMAGLRGGACCRGLPGAGSAHSRRCPAHVRRGGPHQPLALVIINLPHPQAFGRRTSVPGASGHSERPGRVTPGLIRAELSSQREIQRHPGRTGEGRDRAALAGLASLAEAAGWDAFFLEDYLSYRGLPTYDPWVCLAAIAAATTRIRLGTTVTPLPRRHPWELAAQAVTVDHLSGGRLILGVGSGAADDPVFTTVGTPMTAPERAARLDEGLHILTALWTGTVVHHHGPCYRIDGLQLPATPIQQPRIPIWTGGDLRQPGSPPADPMGRRLRLPGASPRP